MVERFYRLGRVRHPWGDYFDILAHGMAWHVGKRLLVSRTGPFAPPMWMPYTGLLVRDDLRQELRRSKLRGLRFRAAQLEHIVKLDWRRWDRSAKEPAKYPAGGEPESYLTSRRHSPELAEQMGRVHEVCLQPGIALQRTPRDRLRLILSTWNGHDLFFGEQTKVVFATERARAWLDPRVGEFLTFEPAKLAAE